MGGLYQFTQNHKDQFSIHQKKKRKRMKLKSCLDNNDYYIYYILGTSYVFYTFPCLILTANLGGRYHCYEHLQMEKLRCEMFKLPW